MSRPGSTTVPLQIAVGICLIIFTGGTVAYLADGHVHGGGIAIIAIGFAFVFALTKKLWLQPQVESSDDGVPAVAERIGDLEKRISDVQEIVIDEKPTHLAQDQPAT